MQRRTLLFGLLGLAAPTSSPPSLVLDTPYGPQQARAAQGIVTSTNIYASRVGADILKRGGNAVDAACAVALALAVTHPEAGNLGGGGFMLIRLADGRTTAIDYRETAPAAASHNMYLDAQGNLIPNASLVGYRAVGVPGTVAGLALAQSRYGRLTWRDIVEPARQLAAEGFLLGRGTAAHLKSNRALAKFPESRRVFQRNGRFYQEGERFVQPDLARTLTRLASGGPREFYEGHTAELLAADMAAHGGLVTRADLKAYRAVERTPLRGTYRGREIITMPPPSSGGAVLLSMLNALEPIDLKALGNTSSAYDHRLIEVMRRAFADRAALFGDPDFVKVPTAGLISKAYAARRYADIDPDHATPSATIQAGNPNASAAATRHESLETTHFCVVDAAGNCVSNTYTLNTAFGCGVTATGTGILLNNEMDDFAAKPGTPNGFGLVQGEANAIAPRKRPLSSMTPTIVLQNNKPLLVVGSPGGPTIITTVLQVLLNVLDFGMTPGQAVAAPRLHHQWLPDQVFVERDGMPPEVRAVLEAKGHRFAPPGSTFPGTHWGDAHAIGIEPGSGIRAGAADPRNEGAVIGY